MDRWLITMKNWLESKGGTGDIYGSRFFPMPGRTREKVW